MMPSYRQIRATGWITLGLFFLTVFTPISNIIAGSFAIAPRLDTSAAIVVLAAGLFRNGELNNESMRRVVQGISLYRKRLAPLIVLSGPGRADAATRSEAAIRAELARSMGVPPEAILIVDDAKTTREESNRAAGLLLERNAKRILLVTDSVHMRRARAVFERAGCEVFPAPSDDFANAAASPDARLSLAIRFARETAALLYYRIAGYV